MLKFFQKTRLFLAETGTELKKASWPGRQELWQSTVLVLFAVMLLGFFVALFDFSLYNFVSFFTQWVKA